MKKSLLVILAALSFTSFAGEVSIRSHSRSEFEGFVTNYTASVTCDSKSFIGKQVRKYKTEGYKFFSIQKGRFSEAPVLKFTFESTRFDSAGVPQDEYTVDAAEIVLDSNCVWRAKETKKKL